MQLFQNFWILLLFGDVFGGNCPKPNTIRIRENDGQKKFNEFSPWLEIAASDVDDLDISDDPENNGKGISDK